MFLSLRKSKSCVSLGVKFCFNLDSVMLRHFSVAESCGIHHQVLVDGPELYSQGRALESNHPLILSVFLLSWQERASVAVAEPDLDW